MARFFPPISKWFAQVDFQEFPGVVSCSVRKQRAVFKARIETPEVIAERKKGVQELSDGLKMIIRHAVKSVNGDLHRMRGTNVDPDESADGFVLPVFPKHPKRYQIVVKKDFMSGLVEANVPEMIFDDDIPGAIQAAHVLGQCASLMKAYER